MRQHKRSPNNFPEADWQILDELELSVGSTMDEKININTWLTETLRPLKLQADFLNKVLNSAQDAITRTMQVSAMMEFVHIHLLIFAPTDFTSNRQIWGFFLIEKVGGSLVDANPSNHLIEFYLYLEDK